MWRRHKHLLAHELMPILRSLTGVRCGWLIALGQGAFVIVP
jgi:uncharacterized membrane protein YedE/YeeE